MFSELFSFAVGRKSAEPIELDVGVTPDLAVELVETGHISFEDGDVTVTIRVCEDT